VWLAISIAALAAAWWMAAPGAGLVRWVWLIGLFAWYPVLYALQFGQPAPAVLLGVVACWKLTENKQPVQAGVVLGLATGLKPQLVLAVPLVLLVSGRWRVFFAWTATSAALALTSIALLGANGVGDYRGLIAEAQNLPNNRYFTLAYLLGPGPASYAAQGVVLV